MFCTLPVAVVVLVSQIGGPGRVGANLNTSTNWLCVCGISDDYYYSTSSTFKFRIQGLACLNFQLVELVTSLSSTGTLRRHGPPRRRRYLAPAATQLVSGTGITPLAVTGTYGGTGSASEYYQCQPAESPPLALALLKVASRSLLANWGHHCS
jgi:hypothetical protein